MVNSKPRTGEAIIPGHVKQAKDIYMTKLGSLGAYTCCDNIRPHLSIPPPPTEEPDLGASEDEDNPVIDVVESDDHVSTGSPAPTMPASSRHSKASKGASKRQHRQPSSSRGRVSSQAEQRELLNDFLSGRNREERDRVKFQQQTQLTSLAHQFESGRMKDNRISELLEKLDQKRDELHEARLENLRLQQALSLRYLSTRDPEILENIAHASDHLGLPLPRIRQDIGHPSPAKRIRLGPRSSPLSFPLKHEKHPPTLTSPHQVKHEPLSPSPLFTHFTQDLQRSPSLTHIKNECPPSPFVLTPHDVIEILDSDEDEMTGSNPWTDNIDAISESDLDLQQSNVLVPFENRQRELKAVDSKGKGKENVILGDKADKGLVSDRAHVPCAC